MGLGSCRHQDPAVRGVRHAQLQTGVCIGFLKLFGLSFEDAREHEMAAGRDVRCQQWRQQFQRGGEDVGQYQRIGALRHAFGIGNGDAGR